MGQFSVEIPPQTGSVLNETQHRLVRRAGVSGSVHLGAAEPFKTQTGSASRPRAGSIVIAAL